MENSFSPNNSRRVSSISLRFSFALIIVVTLLLIAFAAVGILLNITRMDYAAVGKVTILASRLSSEANGGQILTDQKTLSKVEHLVEAEPLKELQLKGFNRPTAVFNILGLRC